MIKDTHQKFRKKIGLQIAKYFDQNTETKLAFFLLINQHTILVALVLTVARWSGSSHGQEL